MATIWLNVIRADGLRAADKNGFSDPYAVCQVIVSESGQPLKKPKCKLKTKTCKKTLTPEWKEEEVWTGIIAPLETLSLRLEVFDKDTFSSEGLGRVDVPLGDLPNDEWKESWFNLESSGQEQSRIEIKIKVRPAVTADPPQANQTSDQSAETKSTEAVAASVGGGSSAPTTIAPTAPPPTAPPPTASPPTEAATAPTPAAAFVGGGEGKGNSAPSAAKPPPESTVVPVVSMLDQKSPEPLAAEEAGPSESPGQTPLVGQGTESSSSAQIAEPGDQEVHNSFQANDPSYLQPSPSDNKLDIRLLRGQRLPAMDKSRFSRSKGANPVVTFRLGDFDCASSVKKKTVNPSWDESFQLPVESAHQILQITVEDEDAKKKRRFMGYVELPILQLQGKGPTSLTLNLDDQDQHQDDHKDRGCLDLELSLSLKQESSASPSTSDGLQGTSTTDLHSSTCPESVSTNQPQSGHSRTAAAGPPIWTKAFNKCIASGNVRLDLARLNLQDSIPWDLMCGKFANLTNLNLKGNDLDLLSPVVCTLTQLEILVLSFNRLSHLDGCDFSKLTQLRLLAIDHNLFDKLPLVILEGEFGRGLHFLNASHNRLKQLPSEICNLTGLKNLFLAENDLESVPEEMVLLAQYEIEVLDFAGNAKLTLPPLLAAMASKTLYKVKSERQEAIKNAMKIKARILQREKEREERDEVGWS